MNSRIMIVFGILFSLMLSCQSTSQWPDAEAPVAKIEPTKLEKHGDVRTDDYYWLRDRENPEVVAYLEAENAYTEVMLEHNQALGNTLFEEFKARIKQTDETVPYRKNGYYYYSRTEDGKQYSIYCRKKGSLDAAEEVVVDLNELAEGHKYTSVSKREVSPDNKLLAYSVDFVGRRFYEIRVRDLASGEDLADRIPNVTGLVVWANDSKTFFYGKQDPTTLRWNQVWRHELGTDAARDVLVYEEKDETFSCGVGKSKSEAYIAISCTQTLASEFWYLDANTPRGKFRVVEPRQRDHEYSVEHAGDFFYIRTNSEARNFRVMKAPVAKPGMKNWTEVIPHREDAFVDELEVFRSHLFVAERKEGLVQLRVRRHDGEGDHYIDFGEPAYTASTTANHEFDAAVVRYSYSSMTTPKSIYDYDMESREKGLLKQDDVLAAFDRDNYKTERLYATARDGAKVPISLVYRKDRFAKEGTNPLHLHSYGSYGASTDAKFSAYRISLLDRGFVYAEAHIRGGQEMGRHWYEDGKLLKKKNTFTDFIDCADYLIAERYADPERVFASGGSAGGLLMGAIVNMRPDLWRGVIAHVPFVDVITTMLDETIPLTSSEWDEWGNPNDKEYYDYMLSYSPYDQVEAKAYPNLLVTTALRDSQVQYWEPAKWVARLRAVKTDDNALLLKTEMEASHGGQSGRYNRYRDTALEYAFLLDLAGIRE